MKLRLLSSLLTLPLAFAPAIRAQDAVPPEAAGFLQVINLVSQKSPTYLSLAGFAFNRGDPIEVGGGSGTLALRPGRFDLKLSNDIAEPETSSIAVEIENGKTVVVICFDEVRVKDDGKEEVKLRFSQLTEAAETDTAKLTVVSLVDRREIPLSIEGRSYLAAPKAPIKADIDGRETVAIRSDGKTLIDFETRRPGHYLVFLFDDPELGEVSASYIHNEKLEYQPPLDEEGD